MENYTPIQVIGKGSFGVVSKIRRNSDGKILVWKEVQYGFLSEREKQLIVTEVNLLRELRHPYIVRYLDRVIDKASTKIYIVMEYCEGGDLGQLIKRHKKERKPISERLIWSVFSHVFLALKECHRHTEGNSLKPILHRDIKPGNVLLDDKGNAKLGDFGLAKELGSESRFARTNVGTPYYMSPEMVNEMSYDERSDIWALGCLLYEMAALHPPFDASNHLALAKKISAGKFAPIPSHYSSQLSKVIEWMLNRQRSKRPRIEDLEGYKPLATLLKVPSSVVTEQQIVTKYNTKLKEIRVLEERLRMQEAEILQREKRVYESEQEVKEREDRVLLREESVYKREQQVITDASRATTLKSSYLDDEVSYGSGCSSASSSTSSGHSSHHRLRKQPHCSSFGIDGSSDDDDNNNSGHSPSSHYSKHMLYCSSCHLSRSHCACGGNYSKYDNASYGNQPQETQQQHAVYRKAFNSPVRRSSDTRLYYGDENNRGTGVVSSAGKYRTTPPPKTNVEKCPSTEALLKRWRI